MRAIDADALRKNMKFICMGVMAGTENFNAPLLEIDNAPTIQPEPHWIPVTERLPEVGESVLICDAYGDICTGHRTSSGYYFPDFCDDKIKDVRAWAELPEPYKGVTE